MRIVHATPAMIAFVLAGLYVAPASADQPIVIKFSHVVAESTPKGRAALHFKQLVEQRLSGIVTVEVYPNALLVDDEGVVAALQQQTVQMAAPSLSQLENYSKAYRVFDVPFLLQSTEAVERFQNGAHGQALLQAMQPAGIEGLCFLHNGMKQLSADRALHVPADAKGLKFRIQSSSVLEAQFVALGAIPVRAPFSKTFHLLQTGTVNGQENTWSNIYSQKFYTVQPFITETNHGSLEYLLITSTAFWQRLPDNVRNVLAQSARESCDYGNNMAAEINTADQQRILQYGGTHVITLTTAQRGQWVDAMQPVWKSLEAEIGTEIINAAMAANRSS